MYDPVNPCKLINDDSMHGWILYTTTNPTNNGDSFGWLPLDTLIVNISVLNPGTRTRSCEYPIQASGVYTPIEQVGLQRRTNLAKKD